MKPLNKWLELYKDFFSSRARDLIIQGFTSERQTSFRLCSRSPTHRIQFMDLAVSLGVSLKPVWWENTVFGSDLSRSRDRNSKAYKIRNALISSLLYKQGVFNLQSLSSSIPVAILEKTGALKGKIIDLCAAPGSKSSQILDSFKNDISESALHSLTSQDISLQRTARLLKTLQRTNPTFLADEKKVIIRTKDSTKLERFEKASFDCVILDAPCSGEGIFSENLPETFRDYSLSAVSEKVTRQTLLLRAAAHLVKSNGYILYSTCSLNPYENEERVANLLKHDDTLEVIDLHAVLKVPSEHGETFLQARDYGMKKLSSCLRILPCEQYEGFFIALLQKKGI